MTNEMKSGFFSEPYVRGLMSLAGDPLDVSASVEVEDTRLQSAVARVAIATWSHSRATAIIDVFERYIYDPKTKQFHRRLLRANPTSYIASDYFGELYERLDTEDPEILANVPLVLDALTLKGIKSR